MFHNAFICACLPIVSWRETKTWFCVATSLLTDVVCVLLHHDQIFGDDWSNCSERVMRQLGITRIKPECLIMTPRRFGKTVSVAMFVCAMLLSCPGIKICIFSTGKRASSNLMQEIMDRLSFIEGGRERVVKHNQEQVSFTLYTAHRNYSTH